MQQQIPNPVLGRLEALVGEWETVASIGGQPTGQGHTRFEWLEANLPRPACRCRTASAERAP